MGLIVPFLVLLTVFVISAKGYQRPFEPHLMNPNILQKRVEPFSLSKVQPGNGSWFESDTKKYYLEYRFLRFHDVKDYCKDLNMTMIHIRNWRENYFVRDLDNRNLIPIGIEFSEGRWKWSDGSDLTYTNWDEWEPRCGSFCTTMYMKLSGRWYFDQEGFGIVACETSLYLEGDESDNQLRIKSDRDFQRQLLQTMKDIKTSVEFMRNEVKKKSIKVSQSISSNPEVEQINPMPKTSHRIMIGNMNRTRINP
jgi:hypothetical protein